MGSSNDVADGRPRFDGKVALVTGAGSGIGAAVVRQLAAEGCGEVHVADIAASDAERVADRVGGRAHVVDVSSPLEVDQLFDTIVTTNGRIDVLVHAAGVDDPVTKRWLAEALTTGEPVDVVCRLTDDSWRRMLSINLDGTFHVLRAAVRTMRQQRRGSIVTIGSSAAFDTLAGYPHYAAAKAAVHALTQSVAKEAAVFGVRVNVVAPGPVDTPMAARMPASVRGLMAQAAPAGYATPEQLADNICYLASDGASNVVGAVLLSNGGRFTVT